MSYKTVKKQRLLYFDGAMGTMIKSYGLSINDSIEVYNFTEEETIKKIHREYIKAGADIITTNTFGANEFRFRSDKYTIEEVIRKGIKVAKEAREGNEKILIAYDIGPTGIGVKPIGKLTFAEAYESFRKQIIIAVQNEVDLILIETILNLEECKAAIKASKDYSNLPVFCSFTLNRDGKLFDGTSIEDAIMEITKLDIEAIGINCSPGVKDIYKLIEKIKFFTKKDVIVQPNTRCYIDNLNNFVDISEEEFSEEILMCIKRGAKIIGGCCGTTPKYIRMLKEKIGKL